ncbi:acrosomal protein KIAA1210 homolog [Psammomys obesus]|uniref:acrosomal protein KIAA1210 homolog n=1 Tax=Psammomys obesus TaxID=48139 RepID=UPI0024535EB6|nr:acrosomal protein KIAA1210 homolog [Psammomys obesus]
MAESITEVFNSMEVLETTEEGRKKSKFKAFKLFFGKKKKKETEDVPEGKLLNPGFSTSTVNVSSLKPVLETETENKPKRSMGVKAISHESVFCLEPEPEKSASNQQSSMQAQRGRSLKTPAQPSRLQRFSTSPHATISEKVYQEMQKAIAGDKSPRSSRKKSSSHHSPTPTKSVSEMSSDLELAQSSQSSTQQPSHFSTPATSRGCLDSSAAKQKISLNPRKQKKKKKKKTISTSVKVKQEEQQHSLPSKEKTTVKMKQADQKEQKRDGTELSSQEKSYKPQTQDKETRDQALRSNPRRCRRAKNEWEIIERSLLKSTQEHGLGSRSESSPNKEMTGEEHSFLHLFLEKKGTAQQTTTESKIARSEEMLSDKGGMKREMGDIDVEAQGALAPQPIPTDVVESLVSGSPRCQEDRSSEGKKRKNRAAMLPWTQKSSTSPEEATVLSKVHGEEEKASSPGSQKCQPKMELSLESTTSNKKRHSRSGFRALSASISSATTEGDVSTQISPFPLRRWPNARDISSDSKSTSEYESSSEMQLDPTHPFQAKDDDGEDDDDDDDVFLKSESVDAGPSMMEQQQPLRYSPQSLGKPGAREGFSEPQSSSEDERSCEELTSHSSHSLEDFEECSESKSFALGSISEEQLTPTCHSQAVQVSEEKEASTESSSYMEKYHSSEDLTSSEQASGQFRDQQEAVPVSKSVPKERSVSAKPVLPKTTSSPMVSSISQQQTPTTMNISMGQSRSMETLPPSHTMESWLSTQAEHQEFVELEGVAADWDIFMQPLHNFQPPTRPVFEQEVSAGPEVAIFEESVAAQTLRQPSQSSVQQSIKKEILLGAESDAFEGCASIEPLPPQHHLQPLLNPFIQQQASYRGISMDPRFAMHFFQPQMKLQGMQSFSLAPESTAFEGNTSLEHVPQTLPQPMLQPYQNVPLESKAVAAKMMSMDPMRSTYPAQSLPSPQSQLVSESTSIEGATVVEPLPPQPSVKSKFQPQMSQDSVSTSTLWSSSMEALSPQHIFQTQANPKFMQVPTAPESLEAQGSISMQLVPPRSPSDASVAPTFEQRSILPGTVPVAWAIPIYSAAPRMPSQPLMGSIISVEPMSTRHPLQPWQATPFEHCSAPSDSAAAAAAAAAPAAAAAAAAWGIPIAPPPPIMPSQPLMGTVSTELVSVSVPQSSSVELMPSRFRFQPRADPESYTAEKGVNTMIRPGRHHSSTSMSSESKEDDSPDSVRASGEWSLPTESTPSKNAPQLCLGPEFEQQASNPEVVDEEWNPYKEACLSGHPFQTITKHEVQKTPSNFESPSTEGGILRKPLPSKHPISFLMRSKIQELSTRLEGADPQDSSDKPQKSTAPSQSFVKFMVQQVFSASNANKLGIYAKPMIRSRSRPSRSLLKPKLDEQVFFYNWDKEPTEYTSVKNLLIQQPSQLLREPEKPQEVLPYSEGAPMKRSSSAEDISQPRRKLEYRQKVSVSVNFPEEWKKSEGQLQFTEPSQAFQVSGLQPPKLSTGSANVPVEWRSPEEHRHPGQPIEAVLITDYQQQVYLSSANSAAEGTISEKNTGSWSMPKAPASSTKSMKYSKGYEDLPKITLISDTKPGTFTTVPDQKAFVSQGINSKEEVPQSRDGNESPSILSTRETEVENIFGVRLRRISQKSGMEKPDLFTSFVPVSSSISKESVNKEDLQDLSRGPEKFSPTKFSFVEKQGNRPRYQGIFKKPAVYKPPGNTSNWKADSTTESGCITVAKQRQRGIPSYFAKKPRNRAEIRAETKEPRYESKYDPDSELLPKEPKHKTDTPAKTIFSTIIPRHELAKLRVSKSTKPVAFDDQKIFHTYTREKETRRSSSLPPKFTPPEEPVWFSVAKKKAKAWSQMAEIMQ